LLEASTVNPLKYLSEKIYFISSNKSGTTEFMLSSLDVERRGLFFRTSYEIFKLTFFLQIYGLLI